MSDAMVLVVQIEGRRVGTLQYPSDQDSAVARLHRGIERNANADLPPRRLTVKCDGRLWGEGVVEDGSLRAFKWLKACTLPLCIAPPATSNSAVPLARTASRRLDSDTEWMRRTGGSLR